MKLVVAAALVGLLPHLNQFLPPSRPVTASRAAAAPAPDSTTVRLLYGSESPDLTELMGRVLHVEKQRIELHDRRLAGRRLHLTLQEYRRGVPGPEQELAPNASLPQLDSAGRLALTIYTRPVSARQVENLFILPRFSTPKTFATLPNQEYKYGQYQLLFGIHSLRRSPNQTGAEAHNPAQEFHLPLGPAAILAVYTLPYEKEGFGYYCGLAESRVPVTEWYSRFKVPHFVVYRVRVE